MEALSLSKQAVAACQKGALGRDHVDRHGWDLVNICVVTVLPETVNCTAKYMQCAAYLLRTAHRTFL